MGTPRVQIGLTRCADDIDLSLKNRRFGLLLNQASVDHNLRLSCDILAARFPGQLKALFSPQHGLWGEEQANMVESPHARYTPLDLPIHSLYSETRRPTTEMLHGLDSLVIDLQDVGTRVYTFIWTLLECLHACAEAGISIVVLDRPNPLGGLVVEGPILETAFRSFVGNAEIPLRHGLTIGELARLFCREQAIDVDLHIVPMSGWNRCNLFANLDLPWVLPSPNMPRFESAVLYPGQVLLEGTNLSEGRGTTLPFEVVGAPFLNAHDLSAALQRCDFPGVIIRPLRFRPTFDKWSQQTCEGVGIHVSDYHAVRSVSMTIAILKTIHELAGDQFAWLPPPYEYEHVRPPIDILYGSDRLRLAMSGKIAVESAELAVCDEAAWRNRTADLLLYQ